MKKPKKILGMLCFAGSIVFLVAISQTAYGHYDEAYFRSDKDPFLQRHSWMKGLRDDVRISALAIPGTHDSGAYKGITEYAKCQGIDFDRQLSVGIRFFDIRVRHIDNVFTLHHGRVYLKLVFGDFLASVSNFLNSNPSETVLFRLKKDHPDGKKVTRSMRETLDDYLKRYPKILRTTDQALTLGQARGKYVIVCDDDFCKDLGLNYGSMQIQDYFDLGSIRNMYDKWEKVKEALDTHSNGDPNKFYMNYFSGSGVEGGIFPFFVASGHSKPGTSDQRKVVGRTTKHIPNPYPDFPRVDCRNGFCEVLYEGMNILGSDKIHEYNRDGGRRRTIGIIMADFPGDRLIAEIIFNNGRFNR